MELKYSAGEARQFSQKDTNTGEVFHGICSHIRFHPPDGFRLPSNRVFPRSVGQVLLFIEDERTLSTKPDPPFNHVHQIGELLENGHLPPSVYDEAICNIAEYQRDSWRKQPWGGFHPLDNPFEFQDVLIHKSNPPPDRYILTYQITSRESAYSYGITVELNDYGHAPIGPIAGELKAVIEQYDLRSGTDGKPEAVSIYIGIVHLPLTNNDTLTGHTPQVLCSTAMTRSLAQGKVPVQVYDDAVCALSDYREHYWRSRKNGII